MRRGENLYFTLTELGINMACHPRLPLSASNLIQYTLVLETSLLMNWGKKSRNKQMLRADRLIQAQNLRVNSEICEAVSLGALRIQS